MSGCDQISPSGFGKKSYWKAWQLNPEITLHFKRLSHHGPSHAHIEAAMDPFQRFIIRMYGINYGNIKEVNATRHYLAHRNKEFENMPPCYDTLHLLLQRVTYVADFIWSNSLVKAPVLVFHLISSRSPPRNRRE